MSVTKTDLVAILADEVGITKRLAGDVWDSVVGIIGEQIAAGNEVRLNGLGTWKVVSRSARKGRNPRTGATIQIKATKAVKYSPAKALKEAAKRS